MIVGTWAVACRTVVFMAPGQDAIVHCRFVFLVPRRQCVRHRLSLSRSEGFLKVPVAGGQVEATIFIDQLQVMVLVCLVLV